MHGLLNTLTNWNIKMLNGWALNLNDEEERCAQGTCPDSGRKDYCRSLNQNRSLEVIKGTKKKRHIFITMTKKTANCISNFKMRICNYFEYHWCIPEKVKGMCIIIMQTYLCSFLTPVLLFFFFFLSTLGFHTAGSSWYLWHRDTCSLWMPKHVLGMFFLCLAMALWSSGHAGEGIQLSSYEIRQKLTAKSSRLGT